MESNRYAQECKGELFTNWQPITVEELLAYIGSMILMGIVKLPRMEDYWKKDTIYHYTPVASRILREGTSLVPPLRRQQHACSTWHSRIRQARQIGTNHQNDWRAICCCVSWKTCQHQRGGDSFQGMLQSQAVSSNEAY